ncbi:putative alpha-galactosidase C [Kockovaella imperatae]|uniref:Alpha-galactosidase n=1 Tax=Kockovaella imperatae TaxID=4999 RepID=A0A1Y1UFX3_9TREE|nr:putative alpha-galactosidase C [Kockovaella imperatae]ORX36961.1 putative alpha-galactosidase C [Kockovaella imperatae]
MHQPSKMITGIVVDGQSFAIHTTSTSYRFHVDEEGDLVTDHFGAFSPETVPPPPFKISGWVNKHSRQRREYPDFGRGDLRLPAVRIQHSNGSVVCQFKYVSHEIRKGKPEVAALPTAYGGEDDVEVLTLHLKDELANVELELAYSVFPADNVIVRAAKITNKGSERVVVEKAASWSVDLPAGEYEMLSLRGDHNREAIRARRRVEYGVQSIGSNHGYSSHVHNPYVALFPPHTTETQGEAWAFNLIYTGSHSIEVEKVTDGQTRVVVGTNPLHMSYPLAQGESFLTPECVATFSINGLGTTSRNLHRFYRKHLMRGPTAVADRAVLLNSWEGLYFNFDHARIATLAKHTADLGIKLFVLDDGWFGNKYPRINDQAGLGDWVANRERFPDGMPKFVDKVAGIPVAHSDDKLRFGIWVEPEMVNPKSELYDAHPDWILHSGDYPRTVTRNQLVLDLSKKPVQDYIIDALSKVLSEANITYIKWDNNRAMHEMTTPATAHDYILGLYRVLHTLTTRFPHVLWEGCASGGGRFDAGLLPYFPVSWTSDNTDALDRIFIQFGTSLAYPAASMGCHVSAVPNHSTFRTTSLEFRAHVAMMGGSFGFELDPAQMTKEEQEVIPQLVKLAERVNPLIVRGDQYRLALPDESNQPAVMYLSEDGSQGVLFVYQMQSVLNYASQPIRFQGLEPEAKYKLETGETWTGSTLMNAGLYFAMRGDYQSKMVFFQRV